MTKLASVNLDRPFQNWTQKCWQCRKWPSESECLTENDLQKVTLRSRCPQNTQGNYTLRKSYPCTHKGELCIYPHPYKRTLTSRKLTLIPTPHNDIYCTNINIELKVWVWSLSVCLWVYDFLIGDIFLLWVCVAWVWFAEGITIYFSCVSRNSEGTIFCGSLSALSAFLGPVLVCHI